MEYNIKHENAPLVNLSVPQPKSTTHDTPSVFRAY